MEIFSITQSIQIKSGILKSKLISIFSNKQTTKILNESDCFEIINHQIIIKLKLKILIESLNLKNLLNLITKEYFNFLSMLGIYKVNTFEIEIV